MMVLVQTAEAPWTCLELLYCYGQWWEKEFKLLSFCSLIQALHLLLCWHEHLSNCLMQGHWSGRKENNHFLPWGFSTAGQVLDPVLCTKSSAGMMKRRVPAFSPCLPALTIPKQSLDEGINPFPSLTCGALKGNVFIMGLQTTARCLKICSLIVGSGPLSPVSVT